ncbi:MAG: hypothetical protein ACI38Q_07175 [Candidatus Bruticola sp.]
MGSRFSKFKKFVATVGECGLVVSLYTVLALIFTYPLVLNYSDYVIGCMESDVWKHLWGMWWMHGRLIEDKVLPLHTFLLNYPYGGALYFIDSLNGLLSLPLQSFLTIVQTFNTMVIFNLVLAASGTYLLVKGLTGRPMASFAAGTVYAFSAYMGSSIASGITESINIGWMPFFCHYFIRLFKTRSWKDACWAAVFFSLNTLGCWYFGTFAVLFAVFYYIWLLAERSGQIRRDISADLFRFLLPPWNPEFTSGLVILSCWWYLMTKLSALPVHLGTGFVLFSDLVACVFMPLFIAAAWYIWSSPRTPFSSRYWLLVVLACEMLVSYWPCSYLWNKAGMSWNWQPLSFGLAVCLGWGIVWAVTKLCFTLLYKWSAPASRSEAAAVQISQASVALRMVAAKFWLMKILSLLFFGAAGLAMSSGNVLWGGIGGSLTLSFLLLVLASIWQHSVLTGCIKEAAAVSGGAVCSSAPLFVRWAHYSLANFNFIIWGLILAMLLVQYLLAYDYSPLGLFFVWLACAQMVELLPFVSRRWRLNFERYLNKRWSVSINDLSRIYWHGYFKVPCFMVLVCAVMIAGPFIAFKSTINASDSIVFRGRSEMNVDLHLSRQFYNVMTLKDFFVGGKERAVESYTVDRLIRACYVGWCALALSVGGLLWGRRRRDRGYWVFCTLIFMMFATGPFMYVSDEIYSTVKSPLYMFFFRYFPTFSAISIPFRFSILVMLSLAVLSAYTLADLERQLSKREGLLLTVAVCAAILFEVSVFSPSPFPLPLSEAKMPQYCADIAAAGGDYGLIDFPIQRTRGELLPGEYFFYQTGHLQAIPNRVEGTIPLFVYQNSFTSYLFILEHSKGDIPERSREELDVGFSDLMRFRFRYIVVHNNYLRRRAKEKLHIMLRFYCGEPKRYPKGVYVYTIPRPSELSSDVKIKET